MEEVANGEREEVDSRKFKVESRREDWESPYARRRRTARVRGTKVKGIVRSELEAHFK